LGNFENLEIDQNFDKVFCINVVYFWNNLAEPFRKIHSILNPNGAFCFYMLHADNLEVLKFTDSQVFNKYKIEYVIEQLKLAGFSSVKYEYHNGYCVRAEK
jgi:predicted TPR repeat methyltransferase